MRRDKRRKHRHWQVRVYYHDSEIFARTYIDEERAHRFAERQKKSPVVKTVVVREVNPLGKARTRGNSTVRGRLGLRERQAEGTLGRAQFSEGVPQRVPESGPAELRNIATRPRRDSKEVSRSARTARSGKAK